MKYFLILEENLELRSILDSIIHFNFIESRCHFVKSATEAIDYLKKNDVDVIISSLGIKKEHGLSILIECQSLGIKKPIIILTANLFVMKEEIILAGAFDFLYKDNIVKELPKSITKALADSAPTFSPE